MIWYRLVLYPLTDVDEEFLTTSQGEFIAVSAGPADSELSSNQDTKDPSAADDPSSSPPSNNSDETSTDEFKLRSCLPAHMFSRDEFSIWHILRQCIGKVI